jgi:ketosteroid isomerase-like protein
MADKNIELVQNLYAAFGRGDLPFILEHLAENVAWGADTVATEVPWYGVQHGRANATRFFHALAEHTEFHAFNPHGFVAAGNEVFNFLAYEATMKRSGKRLKMLSLQHWTIENGRVTHWTEYEDTAAVRDAFHP